MSENLSIYTVTNLILQLQEKQDKTKKNKYPFTKERMAYYLYYCQGVFFEMYDKRLFNEDFYVIGDTLVMQSLDNYKMEEGVLTTDSIDEHLTYHMPFCKSIMDVKEQKVINYVVSKLFNVSTDTLKRVVSKQDPWVLAVTEHSGKITKMSMYQFFTHAKEEKIDYDINDISY